MSEHFEGGVKVRWIAVFVLAVSPLALAFASPYDTLFVREIGDTQKIYHLDFERSCGSKFAPRVEIRHDSVVFVEADTATRWMTCSCVYDTKAVVVGLQAGSYYLVLARQLHIVAGYNPPVILRDTVWFVRSLPIVVSRSSSLPYSWASSIGGCGSSNPLESVNERQFQPTTPYLRPSYPNPFNPTTTIRYLLPAAEVVRVAVTDDLGREVAVLEEGLQTAGAHEVVFDAHGLSSGVYFCSLRVGGRIETQRMVLSK